MLNLSLTTFLYAVELVLAECFLEVCLWAVFSQHACLAPGHTKLHLRGDSI